MESDLVRYSDDFFSKASIYWHPIFPLLARTFENCHSATNGALNHLKPVAETFKNDVQVFVEYTKKSKPAHHPNKEVDSLVVSCISELRSHLLILEQVDHLVDAFCQNCNTNIKRNLSLENIFGHEDPFSNFDSSSEDDSDWFEEITGNQSRRAKRPKMDSDWIRKYSNIISDYMSKNVKRRAIEGPMDLSKCIKTGDTTVQKDSVVQYRAATQIFQSPEAGSSDTCTAYRSVEYVVWENGSKKPLVPAKPVPVLPQSFTKYKKPTVGPQVVGNNHQELNTNLHKPTASYQHGPCPIMPAPVRGININIEPNRQDIVAANHGTSLEANKCNGTGLKNLETSDFSNVTAFTDYSDTLPTCDSVNSIDATKHSTTFSALTAFGDSQSLMSVSANQTNEIAKLSTISNEESAANCMSGVKNDKVFPPAKILADERHSGDVSAFNPVSSRTRSSTAASTRIVSTLESDPTARTSDLSNLSVSVDQSNTLQPHAENTTNVTFESHYQEETTLGEGNSKRGNSGVNIAVGEKEHNGGGMGDTFVVYGVDLTVDFYEGKTFDVESVTESALGTTFADSDTESFNRDCEALICTLKKAVRVKRPWDDSRNTKKNLHLLRPFSTPLVGSGWPSPTTNPPDPAEQAFVQDLVKSWEPEAEGRGKRNRKPPAWNDSVTSIRRPPGRGVKFDGETSAILKSWFDDHLSFPYPSTEDVGTLVSATGLTKVQVKAWFTYKRRMARKAGTISSNMETKEM